jgi:hypothetical protein
MHQLTRRTIDKVDPGVKGKAMNVPERGCTAPGTAETGAGLKAVAESANFPG